MADGNTVHSPAVFTEEVNLKIVKVKLGVVGILPRMFGDKQKPKNGTADVKLSNFGFDMTATVTSSKAVDRWAFTLKKLPSEIVVDQSSWKIKEGCVELTLHKKEEISWAGILSSNGLEQANSSGDEDEGQDKKGE